MPKPTTKGGSALKEVTKIKLDEPRLYQVTLHNDDITTMEFVVMVLATVFHKSEEEAYQLMMQVHKAGKAVVGIYSYDVATTRRNKAQQLADKAGFPLMVTIEPVK